MYNQNISQLLFHPTARYSSYLRHAVLQLSLGKLTGLGGGGAGGE